MLQFLLAHPSRIHFPEVFPHPFARKLPHPIVPSEHMRAYKCLQALIVELRAYCSNIYCDLKPVTSLRIFVLRKIEIDVGYGPKHEEINNHKRWY